MAEGHGDEEQWLFKRPIEIRQSGTSPFFEGEAELQKSQTLRLFAQQTFTGRRTAAWNEPIIDNVFFNVCNLLHLISYYMMCVADLEVLLEVSYHLL